MKPALSSPVPVLRSFDEALARGFYLDFLGFEVLFEHRFEQNTPLYMAIRHGACELHLSEHFGDATPGARVRIQCDGLSTWAKSLRDKSYRNARPGNPQETPWGTVELSIEDPFGNHLTFWQAVAPTD